MKMKRYTFTIHLDGKVYQRRAPLTLDVEDTVKTTLESVIESKPFADLQSECCKVFLMPSSNVLKLTKVMENLTQIYPIN